MKTSPSNPRSSPPVALPGLALLAAIMFSVSPVSAAETAPPEPKPFVLFMGADIDVQLGKETHRVKNVAGDSFVIAVNQRLVEVPMNRGPVNMKVTPQLKLTDKTAVVSELRFERAYTPDNDPNLRWAKSQSGSAGQSAVGTTAGQMASAQMGAQLAAQRGAVLAGPSGATFGSDGAAAAATSAYNQAASSAGSDLNSAAYAGQQLQEELDKQLFDAVRVTCEITAPKSLRDPYLVIITQYRVKDEPGVLKHWVYAKALDRLDEYPLKVKILQGGFPPGFEMVKQQLHVYGAGRELGTNESDKRVSLTRDDAHQFTVIDYLTSHKDATLAPTLVLGVSRAEFSPHFTPEALQQEIFVRVNKEGMPGGVFRDAGCTKPHDDAHLQSLAGQARFKPALQAGKPVDSVAKLKIADLAL